MQYHDEMIVHALAKHKQGQSQRAIARDLGINKGTVARWINGQSMQAREIQALQDKAKEVTNSRLAKMQILMDKSLDRIAETIEDASVTQSATVFGILHDKENVMLARQSDTTQGTIIVNMNVDSKEQAELMARVLKRQASNNDM